MPRHPLFALVLALVGAAASAQVAPLPAGITRGASVEGIHEFRLANGLQVLLVPDDSKPTTTVNVTYHVGSRMENYGESGMAHLLEHLLFKGTPTNPEVWGEFSRRGLRANGTTWYDRTNYFASFAANDDTLRWYLGWQADAMVNSFIARKDLDTEMTVVRNEMERGENNPEPRAAAADDGLDVLVAQLRQGHHRRARRRGERRHRPPAGLLPHLLPARQRHADRRRPLRPAEDAGLGGRGVRARSPSPRAALQPTYTLDPVQDGERSVTMRRVGGAPLVYVSHHMSAGAHADFAAAELLAAIFGDAPAGRLHRRLVEPQLAASSFGFAFPLAEPAPLFLGAAARAGAGCRQGARRAAGHARRACATSRSPPKNSSAHAPRG